MNLTEVCRLCLVKSMKTSEELFFPIDEVFESKFSEISNMVLFSSQGFPSTVCISCVTEFEEFYNYRTGLIQKQKRLNLLLNIKDEKDVIKSESKAKKPIVTETVSDELQIVNNEEDDTIDDLNDCEMNEANYENTDYCDENAEYNEIQDSKTRIIFEEVLENDSSDETYELELVEQNQENYDKDVKIKPNDAEDYLSNENDQMTEDPGYECIEEMVEDDKILFAITSDELNENCIIVKSEDGYDAANDRQKRKYVKQDKGKEKRFNCWIENCNASFAFRSTMKKHMNQMHQINCDRNTCLMCGRRFEEYSEFLNHVKTHTRKSECDICKLTFVSEEKMQAHRDRVHKNDEHERCFQCSICFATFKRKEHVNSHITYKHNTENRQFPCKECTSTFLTRQDLKNHERSHTQVMKNCAYCPFECRDLKTIKLHCLKMHNTSKIYKCTCEEAFELYKDYQSHKKNCYSIVDSTTAE